MNAAEPAREAGSRILVVVAEMGHVTQREIVGVTRFAKRSGLSVDIVEGRHFGEETDFAKWVEFWNPGGLIVDPVYAADALAYRKTARLPMVFWDASSISGGLPVDSARVMSDPVSIAETAAHELLRADFRQFAFISALGDPPWSRNRGAAFGRVATGCGRAFASFSSPPDVSRVPDSFQRHLVEFLRSLPMPCGVFAANDATAALVVKAASTLGLRFPDDLTLVGVDDSAEYCERSNPTISSVALDIEAGGETAARLLAERMRGPSPSGDRKTPSVVTYGAERLVRRSSSRLTRDRRVDRAFECIRLHACEEGFGPRKVVRQMGVSSTLAYPLFHAAAGRTILDEIHAVRLARAMDLLENGTFPYVVASQCGYASHADFRRVFRQRIGVTVRRWTLDHRK